MSKLYDFTIKDIKKQDRRLGELLEGKVAVIVNTASACGFTPQYKGLEELYQSYKDRGFVVIGFPCNQFGAQEKGTEEDIDNFVCERFKATFPMMAKVDVNGDSASPVYKWLKSEKPGFLGTEGIKWNFSKFLINREGKVVERYAPTTEPKSIAKDIEKLL